MSHSYDHATPGEALLIYNMVRNRLPGIVDSPANIILLSNFTWELMNQLEVCFRIATDKGNITEDKTRIGKEENYSALEQSLTADLVTALLLMMNISTSKSAQAAGTFLKKAKAGSAEVEYDQFNTSLVNGSIIGKESLLGFYKSAAINKASQMGCIIDITDEFSLNVMLAATSNVQPFITFRSCRNDID